MPLTMAAGREELIEGIADAVRAHPAVARLDAGALGIVASYLPGRRVTGVRVPDDDGPIEIALVIRLGHSIPDAARDIRSLVRGLAGAVPVDLTVTDLAVGPADEDPADDDPADGPTAVSPDPTETAVVTAAHQPPRSPQ